jgi:hypothetical protein
MDVGNDAWKRQGTAEGPEFVDQAHKLLDSVDLSSTSVNVPLWHTGAQYRFLKG